MVQLVACVLTSSAAAGAEDYDIYSRYSDGSALALCTATGSFVALEAGEAEPATHAVRFSQRCFHERLRLAIDVFNSVADEPYVCQRLELTLPAGAAALFESPVAYRYARWLPRESASELGADGSLSWESADRLSRLWLPRHRKFFSVTYPVVVPADSGPQPVGASRGEGGTLLKVMEQTFSAAEPPPRWEELLARACLRVDGAPAGSAVECVVELPLARVGEVCRPLAPPEGLPAFASGVTQYPTRCGAPRVLWTADAWYALAPSSGEVDVHLAPDRACVLQTSHAGQFLTVFGGSDGAGDGRLFDRASGDAALRALGIDGVSALAVAELAADFCCRARVGASCADAAAQERGVVQTPAAPGVSEQVVIAGDEVPAGRYTAHSNGHVNVAFVDRALLHLQPGVGDATLATVTLPDTTVVRVNAHTPVGVEQYVAAAMRFANWALADSEQRDYAESLQSCLDDAVQATQLQAQLFLGTQGESAVQHRSLDDVQAGLPEGPDLQTRISLVDKFLAQNAA